MAAVEPCTSDISLLQVLHSGIPVTVIPLDATNTIPVTESVFKAFEQKQNTYEAQYSFKALKMAHDTWPDNHFHEVILTDCFLYCSS